MGTATDHIENVSASPYEEKPGQVHREVHLTYAVCAPRRSRSPTPTRPAWTSPRNLSPGGVTSGGDDLGAVLRDCEGEAAQHVLPAGEHRARAVPSVVAALLGARHPQPFA
jgi:hypothetical protein